ncbi:MAG: hypothetical protein QXO19_03430 [Candidatus Aenigmatarchaeota archaeon]
MGFKIGVTTGLYYIKSAEELAGVVRKLGYVLTKGANVVELSGEVPHEIDYTSGLELRNISEKQGVELLFHGSLTVPMTEGEREQWDTAYNHMKYSFRSAVFGGCKYVLFHASLYYWPELLTRAEVKVRAVMVDENGKLIKEKLKENEALRKWFVEKFGEDYYQIILKSIEIYALRQKAEIEASETAKKEGKNFSELFIEIYKRLIKEKLLEYLKEGKEWESYDIGNYVDIYKILGTYMIITKDPILVEMEKAYGGKIKINWNNHNWFYEQYEKFQKTGGPEAILFKEFFYASVGAKYLEGHLNALFEKALLEIIAEIKGLPIKEEEKETLIKIAKNMKVVLETPDARDPSHAGLYTLWRPKQIIAAIKSFRKNKPWGDKVWANIDFEHIATQGVDPKFELMETGKLIPDFGKYVLSVHSGYPSPLHTHRPIDIGEIRIYELLWELRKAGMGKENDVYLIFERGGGEDPYKNSITALKIFAEHLEKNISPENVGFEFFGISEFSEKRQWLQIKQHALDPLKGLLMVPEETTGFLERAASEKGKRHEEWAKEEYK